MNGRKAHWNGIEHRRRNNANGSGDRPGGDRNPRSFDRQAVWSALGTVLDPELDEPITDLGANSLFGAIAETRIDADAMLMEA